MNATNVGDSAARLLGTPCDDARSKSARVCPFSSSASTPSSTASTALVTNAQPVSRKQRQRVGVPEQVLDLDRDVVGDTPGNSRGEPLRRSAAACRMPLKKSGSPKVMCAGAGGDLRRDVREHDVGRDDAEAAVVDRHDRAMAAAMLAAAAGLGVAGVRARSRAAASRSASAAADRRGPGARNVRRASTPRRAAGDGAPAGRSARASPRSSSNSPPRIGGDAVLAQQRRVQRRVEAVGHQTGARVDRAHAIDDRQRQPRGGVHRQEEARSSVARARRPAASFSRARSSAAYLDPGRRAATAAGDASPNGWRPMS